MYIVGQEEIDAIAAVIRSGALFRYGVGSECDRFERRYAEFLGTRHVATTASGTFALTAAVTALGIGPGDEVLVQRTPIWRPRWRCWPRARSR